MIYLKSFGFPSRERDEHFFDSANPDYKTKNYRTCYATTYPFVMFRERGLPKNFEFGDITIFCGNNGSGKSTVLNVIAETLGLLRDSPYNRSDYFDDYTSLCEYRLAKELLPNSKIITSDDVFEKVLDIRRLNSGIDDKRSSLISEYIENIGDSADTTFHGLDDYERWKSIYDARKKSSTQSQYIRSRLVRNVAEHSNGESALAFFVDKISGGGLYLLDEPENSLSPSNQLAFKYFIEDCTKNEKCQFIISTHSPFLLSLRYAGIYDLDTVPVERRRWTELDCVRAYYDFFKDNEDAFK